MNIAYELLGVGLLIGLLLGTLGSGGKSGLIVEAIQVASRLLEFLDPFLGLSFVKIVSNNVLVQLSLLPTNLCDHHVTVKGASAVCLRGFLNMATDLGDNRRTEGNVGNKVPVPGQRVSIGTVSEVSDDWDKKEW